MAKSKYEVDVLFRKGLPQGGVAMCDYLQSDVDYDSLFNAIRALVTPSSVMMVVRKFLIYQQPFLVGSDYRYPFNLTNTTTDKEIHDWLRLLNREKQRAMKLTKEEDERK